MPTTASNTAPAASVREDFQLTDPGKDSTSSLAWSLTNLGAAGTNYHIAAGNWSSEVLVWNVRDSGSKMEAEQVLKGNHGKAPVLDVCFYPDGKNLFSVGGDNNLRMWSLERPTDKAAVVGSHDKPIKTVGMLGNLVATGGWDNYVKFWDGRTPPTPAQVIDLKSPIYAMDAEGTNLVVATGDRNLHVIDNRCLHQVVVQSALQSQIRCLAWSHDTKVATGGIEGVVSLQDVYAQRSGVSQTFPYHQQRGKAFAINAISFNKKHGFFASAGADRLIRFWKANREGSKRLQTLPPTKLPVSAAKFDESGSLFAYACSYDWSKGSGFAQGQKGNDIFLHRVSVDQKRDTTKKTSYSSKMNKSKACKR